MARRGRTVTLSLFGLVGVGAGLIASNLHTYNRLTDETPVAKLRFYQVKPQQYRTELFTGNFCKPQTFSIFGDEWRIDARFLKWKPWMNLFGMDSMYRLERLTGRYNDIAEANARKHQAWDITEKPAVDLANYADARWFNWSPVDTFYGSSVYETIDTNYEYIVYRGQSGLLTRKQSLAPAHTENGTLVIHIDPDCV